MNAPRVGGSFAVWGGIFSAFDCTIVYAHQKEDPWNSIVAGAITGGFHQMRQGLGPASRSALFGGVLLALIEGAGIVLNRFLTVPQDLALMEDPLAGMPEAIGGVDAGYVPTGCLPQNSPQAPAVAAAMQDPGASSSSSSASSSSSSSSWFGGIFGGANKKEEATGSDGAKVTVLESFDFDMASIPIPTFDYK